MTTAPTRNFTLVIYGNGSGTAHCTQRQQLAVGTNRIPLEPMPKTFVPGRFQITGYAAEGSEEGDITVAGAFFRPAKLSPQTLRTNAPGKRVTVLVNGNPDLLYPGVLVGHHRDTVWLVPDDGGQLLELHGVQSIKYQDTKLYAEDISPTAWLEVEVTKAREYNLTYSYDVAGLYWQISYELEVGSDGLLSIVGRVDITNNTGIDYPQATIILVQGGGRAVKDHHIIAGTGGMSPYPDALYNLSPPPQVTQESVGGTKPFHLVGHHDLLTGQTMQVVAVAMRIPATLQYAVTVKSTDIRYQREAEKPLPVVMNLSFTNDQPGAEATMDMPGGPFTVYSLDQDGLPICIGSGDLPNVSSGQRVLLDYSPPFSNLQARFSILPPATTAEGSESQDLTCQVLLRNYGPTAATVTVNVVLPFPSAYQRRVEMVNAEEAGLTPLAAFIYQRSETVTPHGQDGTDSPETAVPVSTVTPDQSGTADTETAITSTTTSDQGGTAVRFTVRMFADRNIV